MQIESNEVEYCKIDVNCVALDSEIENKLDEVIKLFKDAPVPGFRKHKITSNVIKDYYKKQINESLKRALAEEAYHNTIFEKKIKPVGMPCFHEISLVNKSFSCKFSLLKKPDFELSTYLKLNIPKPVLDSQVNLVQKTLEDLRYKYGNSVQYTENDFIQLGDHIIIDYFATINGEIVENLTTKGELFVVGGNGETLFETNIFGMKVGETREFDIFAPKTSLPSIANKTVHFTVSLVSGSKINPCALDDELAKKVGKEDLNQLMKYVSETITAKIANDNRLSLINSVSNNLVNNNNFKIPEFLSSMEGKFLAKQANFDFDKLSKEDEQMFLDCGARNVKLSLILEKIRESEPDAQLSEQEVFEMVKQILKQSSNNSKLDINEMLNNLNKSGHLEVLIAKIKDEYTLDFVIKNSSIIE